MRCCSTLLFCCAIPILPGADLAERPLYLAVELLPSDFTSTVKSDNGTFHGSDSAANYGIAAGLRWSFAAAGWAHGPVIGVEAATEKASFSTGSHAATELRALGGWAFALNRFWTLQTGLRAGYGLSHLRLDVDNGTDIDAHGDGWSLEPNVELLWRFGERWRVSLGTGWRTSNYTYESGGLDIELDNNGLAVRIGLEWQVSVVPQLLR